MVLWLRPFMQHMAASCCRYHWRVLAPQAIRTNVQDQVDKFNANSNGLQGGSRALWCCMCVGAFVMAVVAVTCSYDHRARSCLALPGRNRGMRGSR